MLLGRGDFEAGFLVVLRPEPLVDSRYKGFDYLGIELFARALFKLFNGIIKRPAFSVAAGRDHGVKGVHYADNPGFNGNLIPLKAVRIARAVIIFMMEHHDLGHFLEIIQGLKNPCTLKNMIAHDQPLLFRELPFLF